MTRPSPQSLQITIDDGSAVSGLLMCPREASACYVFAHGAGAGMEHNFMAAISEGLAERKIATLRYQFPYMDRGSKRPDVPAVAQAAVRAAVAQAPQLMADLPIFAGGKSFGARMTSQAQAANPMTGLQGLIFIGFPLHPAGKLSQDRARHLFDVQLPMLFLQGTRDELADLDLVKEVAGQLGSRATLRLFEHADHSFHVPARSGRTDTQVRSELLDVMAAWISSPTKPGR